MQIVRLSNCKICIYVRGEYPPLHFHVRGPSAGKISRNDLDEVRDWASEPSNLALLLEVWRRLHERD
jgi:hypothetical protein